jgi:anti-sigma regulatory factor (Ser/Thr protein kinase)
VSAEIVSLKKSVAFLTENLPKEFEGVKERVRLAVEELFMNAHKHAYGVTGGAVGMSRGIVFLDGRPCLKIRFSDWGEPFNPYTDAHKPDLSQNLLEKPEGGLGIHLILSLSDHATYSRVLGANVMEVYFFPEMTPKAGKT